MSQITSLRLPNGQEVDFVDWTDQPIFSTCEIEHGATRQEITLFQYTVGDSVPAASATTVIPRTASEKDTNMAAPGAMASTEQMLVYSVRPEYFSLKNTTQGTFIDAAIESNNTAATTAGWPAASALQVATLSEALMLNLEVSQKRYAYAGLGYFNSGMGAFAGAYAGITTAASGASRTVGTAGVPSAEAIRSFAIPVSIAGQEKFRVALTNPTSKALNVGNVENIAQNIGNGAGYSEDTVYVRIRIYLDGLHKRPTA
jgi:hypothetical protein